MRKRHSLYACLYTCDITIVTAHDICMEFIPCFDHAANRFILCFDRPNDKQNNRKRQKIHRLFLNVLKKLLFVFLLF